MQELVGGSTLFLPPTHVPTLKGKLIRSYEKDCAYEGLVRDRHLDLEAHPKLNYQHSSVGILPRDTGILQISY
jgi:hypothetical protein